MSHSSRGCLSIAVGMEKFVELRTICTVIGDKWKQTFKKDYVSLSHAMLRGPTSLYIYLCVCSINDYGSPVNVSLYY